MAQKLCRAVGTAGLLLLFTFALPALAQDAPIGTVKTASGSAAVVRAAERLPATAGLRVFQGDTLETGGAATLGVVFEDNSSITLGANSHVTLDEFQFEPARDELSFLASLLRGSVLYVSGVIAKLSRDSVALRTPVATVGMRGTRFLARVEE